MGQRFTRAPRWAPNDPAGNLNVGESLCNTFCPVFATASPEESPSELSLSQMSSKCDLQNTQTAPLAAVCTPTIKLVQQNHQKLETSNVCVKELLLCFFLSPFTLP